MTLKQAAQTVLRGWLITTESALAEGVRVELEVSWPAQQLAGVLPLMVVLGRVVRTKGTRKRPLLSSKNTNSRRVAAPRCWARATPNKRLRWRSSVTPAGKVNFSPVVASPDGSALRHTSSRANHAA
jgi:hypothetical protein